MSKHGSGRPSTSKHGCPELRRTKLATVELSLWPVATASGSDEFSQLKGTYLKLVPTSHAIQCIGQTFKCLGSSVIPCGVKRVYNSELICISRELESVE